MLLIYNMTSRDHVFKRLRAFSVRKPFGSSNKSAKISYATLQDHVIKGSGDFIEGNSFRTFPPCQYWQQ